LRQPSSPSPDKWLKYEILDLYDLADIEHLRKSIRRFSRAEHATALTQLRREFQIASRDKRRTGEDAFFVAKFVPSKLSILLPNVRIRNIKDLDLLGRAIRDRSDTQDELWFCRTNISPNVLSVAGRIAVDLGNGINSQTIEQVWRCSPRLIETFSPTFAFPFVRATRYGWGWTPRVEHVHVPPSAKESQTIIRNQFAAALLRLDSIRAKLEAFVDAIAAIGLGVCLEYKIEDSQLHIIDWDTANDTKVLDRLLRK
jgi:hypothetical protein